MSHTDERIPQVAYRPTSVRSLAEAARLTVLAEVAGKALEQLLLGRA
jgi:hypothetical protein